MLDDLTSFVTDVVERLGYVGVGALVAIENLIPPIPSEVVLPLAGFVAGGGNASLVGMIIASTIGSVVGAWALYGIAAGLGSHRLHRLVGRYGRWLGLDTAALARAEEWFDRKAGIAVFLGRCVPLIRSLVSLPAGVRRMQPVRFTVLTAAGSVIWNASLIIAGAILGDRWEKVGDIVGLLQGAVIVAIAGLVVWWAWRRFLRPRLVAADDLLHDDAPPLAD